MIVVPASALLTGQDLLAPSANSANSSAVRPGTVPRNGEVTAGDALTRLERDVRLGLKRDVGVTGLRQRVRQSHRKAR